MDIEKITNEAKKAREVFDNYSSEISCIYFGSFPEGACGNSSDFLGYWLELINIEGLEYVWGQNGDISHGWLEINGYIIDITGDQFSEIPPVYISKDKSFHNSFEDQRRNSISVSPMLTGELNKFIGYMQNA